MVGKRNERFPQFPVCNKVTLAKEEDFFPARVDEKCARAKCTMRELKGLLDKNLAHFSTRRLPSRRRRWRAEDTRDESSPKVSVGTRMLRACALHRPPSVAARSPCRLGWPMPCACSAVHAARRRRRSVDATSHRHSKRASSPREAKEPRRVPSPRPLPSPNHLAQPPRPAPPSAPPGKPLTTQVATWCVTLAHGRGEGRGKDGRTLRQRPQLCKAMRLHVLCRGVLFCFSLFCFVLLAHQGSGCFFKRVPWKKPPLQKNKRECAHRLAFEMELRPQAAHSSREWWRWPVCYDVFFLKLAC